MIVIKLQKLNISYIYNLQIIGRQKKFSQILGIIQRVFSIIIKLPNGCQNAKFYDIVKI